MLGVDATIVSALADTGVTLPTRIQSRGIPAILGGSDVILGAATGSGKTLAYLIPIVQQLKHAEQLRSTSSISSSRSQNASALRVRRRARAVVLVPTRELAAQVMKVARALSHVIKFRAACIVGGANVGGGPQGKGQARVSERERERLDQPGGIDVLVATTGRLLQLVDSRLLDIRFTQHVVIDEVDTMFDAGFAPDVRRLLAIAGKALKKNDADSEDDGDTGLHEQQEEVDDNNNDNDEVSNNPRVQLIAAGATHPPTAVAMYQASFHKPVRVDVDLHITPVGLEQRFVRCTVSQKTSELLSLLSYHDDRTTIDDNGGGGVMVFCNTVDSARFVAHLLSEVTNDMVIGCAHADMPAARRDAEWARFRDGTVRVLVATDMAGRGVDHSGVDQVILFDFPTSAVDYVHRAGRTARAGRKGRVTSLVTKRDEPLAKAIETAARRRVDALASEAEAREIARLRRKAAKLAAIKEQQESEENAIGGDGGGGSRGGAAGSRSRSGGGGGRSSSRRSSSSGYGQGRGRGSASTGGRGRRAGGRGGRAGVRRGR